MRLKGLTGLSAPAYPVDPILRFTTKTCFAFHTWRIRARCFSAMLTEAGCNLTCADKRHHGHSMPNCRPWPNGVLPQVTPIRSRRQ